VSFAAITLCIASQRVFIVVSVYFVIDSFRKLLDTPSYFDSRGSFPGSRAAGREVYHKPPSNAKVENAWSYTFMPPYDFMAWCLVKHKYKKQEQCQYQD
jgi:hypothetical protein